MPTSTLANGSGASPPAKVLRKAFRVPVDVADENRGVSQFPAFFDELVGDKLCSMERDTLSFTAGERQTETFAHERNRRPDISVSDRDDHVHAADTPEQVGYLRLDRGGNTGPPSTT